MSNELKQILWVTGKNIENRDFQEEALHFGLELTICDCWDDAFHVLHEDFTKWSAIILQPKSKLHGGSMKNVMQFLPQAFADINVLCATKGKTLPWYLLTDIDESEFVDIVLESRGKWDNAWPKPYYDSSIEEERLMLFKRIKDQTQLNERLQVKTGQYKKVFDALEYLYGHSLNPRTGEIIEDLLVSICFGNNGNMKFGVLREVIENIFHSMIANHLMPYLINVSNRLNNNACSRLLSNMDVTTNGVHYKASFPIMNKMMASNLFRLLTLGNSGSHAAYDDDTRQLEEYIKDSTTNYLLNSCALQLCDIIIWYEGVVKDADKQMLEHGKIVQWWKQDQV